MTKPREPVPCTDVSILMAYEAGRRDMADEMLAAAQKAAEAPDGTAYSWQLDPADRKLARIMARLERLAEDERQ
jgi:hypothetical protein